MNAFKEKFVDLITERLHPGKDLDDDPLGLDPGTPEDTFDDVPENPAIALRKQQYGQTISTLRSWIEETERWIEQLNGIDGDSMNSKLNSVDCDSILADVARSESKKISRLAQDLSSLSESLKQYLLAAEQKKNSRETI